jgi:hypothetical protein
MKWNHNRSLVLSQGFILLFALLLIVVDLTAFWLAEWFVGFSLPLEGMKDRNLLLVTIYSGSVFAWILLYSLWQLLRNMQKSIIFEAINIRHLRWASWACFAAAIICLISTLYYPPLMIIAIAAAFVGLIVRIIKNVFAEAEAMKTELDYTV